MEGDSGIVLDGKSGSKTNYNRGGKKRALRDRVISRLFCQGHLPSLEKQNLSSYSHAVTDLVLSMHKFVGETGVYRVPVTQNRPRCMILYLAQIEHHE